MYYHSLLKMAMAKDLTACLIPSSSLSTESTLESRLGCILPGWVSTLSSSSLRLYLASSSSCTAYSLWTLTCQGEQTWIPQVQMCLFTELGFLQHANLSQETCDDNLNITMCPLCDAVCDYWRLSSVCSLARATYLFDNGATVFFAIFMSLWGKYASQCTFTFM